MTNIWKDAVQSICIFDPFIKIYLTFIKQFTFFNQKEVSKKLDSKNARFSKHISYDTDKKYGFCQETCIHENKKYKQGKICIFDYHRHIRHMIYTLPFFVTKTTCCYYCFQHLLFFIHFLTIFEISKKGETWERRLENGRKMECKCLGNNNSEWHCDYVDMCEHQKVLYLPGETWG